jgi:hypothetical protein
MAGAVAADIIRVIPSKAIELATFDLYKTLLSPHGAHGEVTRRPGPLLTGLAGAAAGGVVTFLHDIELTV